MIPVCNNEMWYVVLYCALSWLLFSLAFWLADRQKRKKEAMVAGLLNLVLVSVLNMLGTFALETMQSGVEMAAGFQIAGVLICSMAVSRVLQMQGWLRTWLAGLLAMLGYLLCGVILAWLMLQQLN